MSRRSADVRPREEWSRDVSEQRDPGPWRHCQLRPELAAREDGGPRPVSQGGEPHLDEGRHPHEREHAVTETDTPAPDLSLEPPEVERAGQQSEDGYRRGLEGHDHRSRRLTLILV